jgi:hypothetical protein
MDIEVLNDLYSRAKSLGYTKSRNDFSVLITQDPKVFIDNYQYIKSQGYTKSQDDFKELIGIDVKKKDISKPVGDGKVITDSTTEQVQAQDILSALQPGKPEDTPIPLRPEEEVAIEEAPMQPIGFDPKTGVPLSGPVDTQFEFDETQEVPIKEKEFEYVDDEIKEQIKKRLIKTPGLESFKDQDVEVLESKFPNLYYEALDVVTSESKAIEAYEDLSDDIKKQIEPAVVKQGDKVIGIDFSVLSKNNIESLIKEAKNQESVKDILDNYISEEKIAYKAAGIKGNELVEEIKDIDKQIEYVKSRGFGLEEIDKLIVESNKKKAQYQGLYNYSAEQSVLLNSAEIAKQNVEMNPLKSGAASALETVLTLGVQSLPVMGSTLLNVGVTAGLPVAAQSSVRVFSSEKEKEWMEWSLEKKKEIEEFIPTDFDDTKANFVGNVVGQIGFVVGSSVLGGTPLAIAAGYTMSAGEMYEEAVNNGLSHDDAMNLSIAYGTISAPLEILGARKGIEALAGKNLRKKVIDEILKKGAKGFTKEVAEEAVKVSLTPVLKATAFEAGEEGLQEGAQYLISKGLAETYNALKDEDKDEFIKTKLMSFDFAKELVTNVVLGAAGGAIGGASLNLLGGNVFVGSNYKAMEDMFLDSKQMAKVNDQLTAYRKNGTIKTDEELQAAKEQVGIVQSAASEVFNATKTRPDKVGSAQQKRLFELTAERLSIQKEIEGVSTPSLVADRKQRIEELDQEISDVITGKITTEEILDRDKVKTEVTEEELVDDFVVSEEEYKNFVDNGEVSEETINKIADIVQQGKKISDKKTLAIYNDKVSEINKILSGRQDSKIAKENKRVDEIFAEEDFDVSEKLSDNLARNKSPEFQIGEKENKIINLATKAAKAIQRVAPNVRVVLHDTTEEYNEFGRKGTKGSYNPQTKIIHIDLSEATNTTVAHETFHSILFNTIGTEKDIEAATNDMYESVKRALATSPIMKRKIRKFSEKYGDDLKSEEALSELFGMLSTDYKQLSAPVKVKIKQFINKVAAKFGLGDIFQLSEQDLSDLETIDLLNTMSARVKEGKTILKKEAKPLTDKKVKDKKPDTSNENPAIREQKGLINITEKDVIKFKKADITEKRTIQAINQIGLSQVKFKREEILKKISEEFEKLMKNSDDYLISVDGPAITASIQNEIDNAAEQGYSLEYLENLTGALEEGSPQRKQYFDTFVNTQRSSIEQWKNYLSQSDYDPAFKYLILDAVLTNNYDYKLNKYQKRTKSTIRGFTPFDAGSLAEVYASDSKELLKDYVVSQVNNAKNIAEKQLMVTTNEGKWLKFEGGPNANNIEASANALSQLVQDTYWCTKTNASSQLRAGDFYVYVTDDAGGNPIPRIAVRMEGDRVGEVRGNASAAQDLEADMLPVAEKFLVDNIPNDSGKRWLESINYNKKVKNFTEKINKQKMKIDFVYEYGEILLEEKKFRVDYDENGLVSLMKEDFNQILSESDLFKNKEVVSDEEQMNENTKVLLGGFLGTVEIPNSLKIIIGDFRQIKSYEAEGAGMGVISGLSPIVEAKSLKNITTITGDIGSNRITDLGKLETVGGEFFLQFSEATSLGNLKTVGGSVKLQSSQVKDLGKLETVGGDIDLRGSQVTDLGNLKSVGRNLNMRNLANVRYKTITSLGNLETVGGDLELARSQVMDLGNLKSVGGNVFLDGSQVKNLGNLETVGNSISLGSEATSLGKLKSVGRDVYLSASQVTSLGNLETVGGDIDLENSQVKDLGNLETVGGDIDLRRSQATSLGKLKFVGGELSLQSSQVKDLGKLETVGGDIYLEGSQVTDLGKLKSVGGDIKGNNELAKQFKDESSVLRIREQKADVSKIKEARSKLSKAKKNLKRKLGAAVDAGPLLNRLLAVNPTIVPESVYDKYLEILDMLSENAEELKLDKAQEVSTKTEEILNKIEDESAKEPEKEKGKKKEYKREKNKLIKDIKKAASVRNPKFALNEESVFAKYLKKLAKSKAVEELSINELKTLSRVLDNINNGWLSHTAWKYATKLQGITNSNVATDAIAKAKLGFVTNAYNNFKRFIRFTEKGTVQKALESIPKYYIDQALSVGQSTDIFDSVLRGIAEAEQIYNFDLRAINKRITAVENAVLKSLKYDGNKAIESSVKQMIYLLNLEYKSNEGNTQVNPVIDFINETIANKKTDKVEKERLNKIKKEYFDGKKLKEKKLYDSFNKAEKESIKEIQKINAELGSKALYTAGVVRGDRIDLLNNYVHHVVIDEKFDGSEVKNVESQIKDFVDSRKPTTKAKSLIQRTGKVTPLNFDIYNSASRGAKYTLMDFYLTEPITTVRETLKRTEEKLKEKGIYDEKSDIFEGIEALLEQDIETTLTNNIASSALIERVVGEISKVAYQRILLNTKRLAQELLGNISYIVLKGRKAFKEGIKYFDVMSSETGPEVMRVVGSLQLNRTYQDADINSRFVEKYNNELSGIRGKKSRSKVVNTAAKIHTATTKKLKNFNDKTASVLMSAPDQIMNRPLWFGTFALEFKKESGVDVDFERIAGKSEAYLEKHAEAIEKAKKKADDVSIEAAASEGLFTGISKGKDWKTEKNALKGSAKFLFYNFNNFMNKFLVYEYTSFAKGWRALMNNGTLSQAEGGFLMAAVTSRMYMYSLLANTGMTGLIGLLANLLGITDEPEEDDEDIRYGAARAGVQTLVNLSQRNFGNATRSLLNWGVEYANENYLDALREGDYNQYKNSIVYNVKPYRDNWIVPFAGPFSPVIKTATLASDAYFPDYEVTRKDAIERRNKEKYLRVPLEILAATGYLPMSNEIIKEVNADIYKDLIKGKKGGVNSSMFDNNLFNKSLFKK